MCHTAYAAPAATQSCGAPILVAGEALQGEPQQARWIEAVFVSRRLLFLFTRHLPACPRAS